MSTYPYKLLQTIDGVDYIREVYNDRLEMLIPVDRNHNPRLFNLRKAMIEADIPQICAKCQSKNNVDAHHIIPIKYIRTDKGHYYQDTNGNHSVSNGQWLCKSCHNKFHHYIT